MDKVTKLNPKWSGTVTQIFQKLDIPNLEFVVIGFKYKGEDKPVRVSWTNINKTDLIFTLECMNHKIKSDTFNI